MAPFMPHTLTPPPSQPCQKQTALDATLTNTRPPLSTNSRTANIARHLHDHHDPTGAPPERRTGAFALAVVRRPRDGKFLLVQEFAGAGFWLPGGGVDAGESLAAGAVREVVEEAGARVAPRGLLALEAHRDGAWRRAIFYAEPEEDEEEGGEGGAGEGQEGDLGAQRQRPAAVAEGVAAPSSSGGGSIASSSLPARADRPKTAPDFDSAGACWVAAADLAAGLPLRSAAEVAWCARVADEGAAAVMRPLELPPEWAPVFEGFPLL